MSSDSLFMDLNNAGVPSLNRQEAEKEVKLLE